MSKRKRGMAEEEKVSKVARRTAREVMDNAMRSG